MKDIVKTKIYELYKSYSLNGKLIDDEFINMLINIYKSNYEINDLLTGLVYITEKSYEDPTLERFTSGLNGLFGRAGYDTIDNRLIVYIDNIRRDDRHVISDESIDFENKIIYSNALLLQTLLHEFNHILQKCPNGIENESERELVKITSTDKQENTSTYAVSLTERLAEIHATDDILEILNLISGDTIVDSKIFEYFEQNKINYSKEPYEIGGEFQSPTEVYVTSMDLDIDKLRKISDTITNLDERILFGLEVDKVEFEEYFNKSKSL